MKSMAMTPRDTAVGRYWALKGTKAPTQPGVLVRRQGHQVTRDQCKGRGRERGVHAQARLGVHQGAAKSPRVTHPHAENDQRRQRNIRGNAERATATLA